MWSPEAEGGGFVVGSIVEFGWRVRMMEGYRKDWTGVEYAVDRAESLELGECAQSTDC